MSNARVSLYTLHSTRPAISLEKANKTPVNRHENGQATNAKIPKRGQSNTEVTLCRQLYDLASAVYNCEYIDDLTDTHRPGIIKRGCIFTKYRKNNHKRVRSGRMI